MTANSVSWDILAKQTGKKRENQGYERQTLV